MLKNKIKLPWSKLVRQEGITLLRKSNRSRKLAAKFKPQFNETIKSLQFRKLYRFEGESTEEWMGRLRIVVAECNYKEIDRQLKEQFIHGLNDKAMLDEVVRELTAKNSSKQTNSEDVLLWARQIKAQRAQAAILNNLTEVQKFHKVGPKTQEQVRNRNNMPGIPQMSMQVLWGKPCTQAVPSIWEIKCKLWENGSLQEGLHEQEELHSS